MYENFDDIFLKPNDVDKPALPEDQFRIPAWAKRPLGMSAQEFLDKINNNTQPRGVPKKHFPNNVWG